MSVSDKGGNDAIQLSTTKFWGFVSRQISAAVETDWPLCGETERSVKFEMKLQALPVLPFLSLLACRSCVAQIQVGIRKFKT